MHFSEACVSGYLGVEVDSGDGLDWDAVRGAMESIARLAAELELWVVIGCNHRLTGSHRPHNSLYVIDPSGRIVDRYDKMFCTGSTAATRTSSTTARAAPSRPSTWTACAADC